LEQLIEPENSHDLERMLALLADDVVIEDVPFVLVMKGKDGVKQAFTNFYTAAPDFKVEPKSLVTNDRSFALEVVFTGTQKGHLPGLPATGKRFSVRGCSFGEFKWQGKGKKGLPGLNKLGKAASRRAKVNFTECPDRRIKAIVFTMTSLGIRLGA
jgi:steroid delta-isomerase-like uncharacterized protein